jgi:hypothetical protein
MKYNRFSLRPNIHTYIRRKLVQKSYIYFKNCFICILSKMRIPQASLFWKDPDSSGWANAISPANLLILGIRLCTLLFERPCRLWILRFWCGIKPAHQFLQYVILTRIYSTFGGNFGCGGNHFSDLNFSSRIMLFILLNNFGN